MSEMQEAKWKVGLCIIVLECIVLSFLWHLAGLPLSFRLATVIGDAPLPSVSAVWDIKEYSGISQWWRGIGATVVTFTILPAVTCLVLFYRSVRGPTAAQSSATTRRSPLLVAAAVAPVLALVGGVVRHLILKG